MTLSHPPRRLDSDADLMIKALFSELDQTLQGKNRFDLVESTAEQDSFHSEKANIDSELTQSSFDYNFYSSFTDDPEPSLDPEEEDYYHPPKRPPFWTRHLDKIIFFSSCSLFMGSLFLLEKEHNFSFAGLRELETVMANSNQETATPANTNSDFINYMERALLEIDREEELAEKIKAQPPRPEELEPVNIAPSPRKAATPKTASPKQVSTLPALPPPPPPLQKATPPAPTPQPSSSNNNPQPSDSQEESVSSVNPQPNPPAVTPQQSGHKLVGLLELGEHSAALLKVQGATQRIMLEETIPGSNWKLVSVANQKATFTNNQQQKVMFIGEEMSLK